MVELILQNPLKLGHHSFIDTVASEVSSISRTMVAECIRDFVQESDQLKDVTLELNDAFQSDPSLFICLKDMLKDQKVTAHRFQQLLKFLKNKSFEEKRDPLKNGLIKACENLQKDYKVRT